MTSANDTQPAGAGRLYSLIWRWHFYAGLLCLPVFILLATTGGLYLFRDELAPLLEHDRLIAPSGPGAASLAPEALIARALAARPGRAIRFTPPSLPGRTAEVGIRGGEGPVTSVFLDPASGRVVGQVAENARPMVLISHIHSLAILGPGPNLLIEVVGGWAILLVASGVYLWLPRGRRSGVVTLRASPKRRVWWRDLHAVVGIFACVFLLFLAVTGMPWSGYWGHHYRVLINGWGLGTPAAVKPASVASDLALAASRAGSWTMDATRAQLSQQLAGQTLSLDRVMRIARERGVAAGYVIRLPDRPAGVFTVQRYPRQATGQRVLHIDRFSGKVLADVGFADYGPLARATELGIAIHTGGQFGRINQLLMAAACLAIIVMSLAGGVMWWRRRPSGRLGAPPAPPRGPLSLSLFALFALLLGLLFPLLGLSMVAALVVDRLLPPLFKTRFGV
ncbi:MAG: PepSY domain-containing protein [Caulobacter sp.]|nr:PepSY domain-containing protein [Caulobacter sp.]